MAAAANRDVERLFPREVDRGTMSLTPEQRAISVGRLSIIPLWTLRASS